MRNKYFHLKDMAELFNTISATFQAGTESQLYGKVKLRELQKQKVCAFTLPEMSIWLTISCKSPNNFSACLRDLLSMEVTSTEHYTAGGLRVTIAVHVRTDLNLGLLMQSSVMMRDRNTSTSHPLSGKFA